tara:strand:+ start:950 stop:1348 length:399 start_codon:yes stop_codon:yes gene_type:complete
MTIPNFVSSISSETVASVEAGLKPSRVYGADLRFHGAVRDLEKGKKISGIEYSFYEAMAQKELDRIGEAMTAEYPDHRALIHHQVGFVAVGVASILIRVQTAHSAEAFEISREYLKRIKTTVPIWKHPVFED